jgi:hypothetical protein
MDGQNQAQQPQTNTQLATSTLSTTLSGCTTKGWPLANSFCFPQQ